MFSFHKPKIYRSNLGCCICKAKSSSSRFTDSKKYENEFERCFRIQEKRSGEICNACVLLVKRWKKLSPENRLTKHWHHVVDARAGPGTKLTGNRRLVAGSSSNSTSGSLSDSNQQSQHQRQHRQQSTVSPLSSSQANNQSVSQSGGSHGSASGNGTGRKRGGSFSKARAIDTNVSTFTFGEPVYRRSYMTTESSFSASSWSTCSSSSLAKPQSALNSSAFESVIKRYRQRQQQQQLDAQRRLLNKQQRQMQVRQNKRQQEGAEGAVLKSIDDEKQRPPAEMVDIQRALGQANDESGGGHTVDQLPTQSKRLKRSSESIGSLTVDGLRVASLLDSSLWRKEKICCGIIFRGLHNEVAVFPKLLKPCQCRVNKKLEQQQQEKLASLVATNHEVENQLGNSMPATPPPPPRTAKSGSISSFDSSSSGTGSMEQPVEERVAPEREALGRHQRVAMRQPAKPTDGTESTSSKAAANRQSAQPVTRRRQKQRASSQKLCTNDLDSNTSSSSSSVLSSARAGTVEGGSRKGSLSSGNNPQEAAASSPASSSSASSLRLLQMAGSEVEDDYDDDEMVDDDDEVEEDEEELLEDEDVESNTDASSSVDSIAEVERKKSTSHVVGAMG